MSKIEANTIDSISGTTTLTLGSSNASTIALGSGDVQKFFKSSYLKHIQTQIKIFQVTPIQN